MSVFGILSFHSRLSPWRASSMGSGGATGRSDRVSPPLSALYFSFLFEFSLVIKLHAPKNRRGYTGAVVVGLTRSFSGRRRHRC